jgi:SAM-dependent methyltransferase
VSVWYTRAFGRLYSAVYAHRDVAEARAVADRVGSVRPLKGLRLLDLACGSGRLSSVLSERGARVVGLDLSWDLLKEAGGAIPRILGDMRALPVGAGSLDGVFLVFTSFGYFPSDDENFGVLDEVGRALSPEGFLLLDLANPSWVEDHFLPVTDRRAGDLLIHEERRWAPRRRIVKDVRVRHAVEGWEEAWTEDVALYDLDDVRPALAAGSFRDLRVWGDYGGGPSGRSSPRLVVLASRSDAQGLPAAQGRIP